MHHNCTRDTHESLKHHFTKPPFANSRKVADVRPEDVLMCSWQSGVHKGGLSKGGFSNLCLTTILLLLNP